MSASPKAREIPACTLCLVLGALLCHIAVLVGNFHAAHSIETMGSSTGGWTEVTLDLANSMAVELDGIAEDIAARLTNATSAIVLVQSRISSFVNSMGTGLVVLQEVANHSDFEVGVTAFEAFDDDLQDIHHVSLLATRVALRRKAPKAAEESENSTTAVEGREVLSPSERLPTSLVATQRTSPASASATERRLQRLQVRHGRTQLSQAAVVHLAGIHLAVEEFMSIISPALKQIGEWLVSFGPKMEAALEVFSVTLDRVQKIFDQIMTQLTPAGPPDEMLHHTYNLFDVSNTGSILPSDIQEVSVLYGITALEGERGRKLFRHHDVDDDGQLSKAEFKDFVASPEIPNAMSFVLRQYSRKLAEVAGNVGAARMRDEVAKKVVDYLHIVVVKNDTKVGWIANRLGNGSLPLAFTADVFIQLAMSMDDPNEQASNGQHPQLTGKTLLRHMVQLHPSHVGEAVDYLVDPSWWRQSGHEPRKHHVVVERVCDFVGFALQEEEGEDDFMDALRRGWLGSFFASVVKESNITKQSQAKPSEWLTKLPVLALQTVHRRSVAHFEASRRLQQHVRQQQHAGKQLSATSRSHTCQKLLGSKCAQAAVVVSVDDDPDVAKVVRNGVVAAPETREFASWLSNNATATAKQLQRLCFDFSSQSSNAVDSFADKVKGMVKSIQGFLKLMEKHSTPRGIKQLQNQVEHFLEHSAKDVLKVAGSAVSAAGESADSGVEHAMSGAWSGLVHAMAELKSILPAVINYVKSARQGISSVTTPMISVFSVFSEKGPGIFQKAAKMYRFVWALYFVLFLIINVTLIFYAFWATGWLCVPAEGPEATPTEQTEEPQTGWRRWLATCRSCCEACCAWRCWKDGHLQFWSMALLAQVVCLVMFMVSIVLALLAGVQLLLQSGCAQLYILHDDTVCTQSLRFLQGFVKTFWTSGDRVIEHACERHALMTCRMVSGNLKASGVLTVLGAMGAVVLSVQLIINSAQLHGKARSKRAGGAGS